MSVCYTSRLADTKLRLLSRGLGPLRVLDYAIVLS